MFGLQSSNNAGIGTGIREGRLLYGVPCFNPKGIICLLHFHVRMMVRPQWGRITNAVVAL